MSMIFQYLRSHRKSVVLFSVCAVILTALYILFRVNLRLIAYGWVVCIAVGLALSVGDFLKYREKHEQLLLLKEEARDTIDHLPQAQDLMEEDYQNMIRNLFADKQKLAYRTQHRFEDMEDYYSTWVHQIKTPISAMHLILQSDPAKRDTDAGQTMDSDAVRRELSDELLKIEQYVEMVLCYLKLDEQGMDYVFTETDLDAVIRQSVRKYAGQFIRSKNKLLYEETGRSVLTDEKWLAFLLDQLLSNALKYTRAGEIRIRFAQPDTLIVEDSGIGIAPEDLPRIFEKGFTGYNGRDYKKSTGIGLYLCRRIAENLGCSITAESKVGEGTRIRLRFLNDPCKNVRYE